MGKKVAIIGYGVSGMATAQNLLKAGGADCEITVVTANKFAEWQLASTYFLARPEEHKRFVAPNSDSWVLKGVKFEFGVVEGMTDGVLHVSGGKTVDFDVVVVAVGFKLPLINTGLGISYDDRAAEVKTAAQKIKDAKSIIIAGGGAVGLELLGDLRETSSAKFTLVVSSEKPLPSSDKKYQDKVMQKLTSWGVDVKTSDKVMDELAPVFERKTYVLQSGGKLEADVFLPAFAQGFMTDFLRNSKSGASVLLADNGGIKVNEFLQSTSYPKLFAVGCSDIKEAALVPKLEAQAKSVAVNVAALVRDKPMKPHKDPMPKATHAIACILGHNTYAFLEHEIAPPGPFLKCCGFPFCPLPCCWCCCHPCSCSLCCADPEGQGTAKLLLGALPMFANGHYKGMGEAPKQQSM